MLDFSPVNPALLAVGQLWEIVAPPGYLFNASTWEVGDTFFILPLGSSAWLRPIIHSSIYYQAGADRKTYVHIHRCRDSKEYDVWWDWLGSYVRLKVSP